ncbi:MAG: hypothetical protein ACREBC_35200, partial [Pyrinomonadaceae bacterium]
MIRSREIRAILQEHVNNPVQGDIRSQRGADIFLGYPMDFTRKSVLRWGLADFNNGRDHLTHGKLTADERVLLYCYFIMKGHFDTARAVFRMNQAALQSLFSANGRVLFVDIGCGPATACLALADLLRNRTFDYVGIDSAVPMQKKAKALWEAAQRESLIGVGSTADFAEAWDDCLKRMQSDTKVLLVFSYFFASNSLTASPMNSLVRFISALRDSPKVAALVMAYMNSSAPHANEKYGWFKRLMG